MKSWIKEHPIIPAFATSIFLHLLILFLVSLDKDLMTLGGTIRPQQANSSLLIRLLKYPEERNQLPVIETPPEPSRRPEDANHRSNKDFTARNPSAPENLPIGDAYSSGISRYAEDATSGNSQPSSSGEAFPPSHKRIQKPASDHLTGTPVPEFHRDLLVNKNSVGANGQSSSAPQRPLFDNRQSRAPELGSFSINTYAWDYAPYLLWLKRRIEQNIYPPPAFTRLGMISGQTGLRFRIYPDGRLEALEVLQTVGHKSLMETSVRAVQLSVPLKPLPADFPEPYLEVTALFEYLVNGR